MQDSKLARLLAYLMGFVNQRLLLQNEYLGAENRILRSHLPSRLRPSALERSTLAEVGKRLAARSFNRQLVSPGRNVGERSWGQHEGHPAAESHC